jgi:hypothetical protein
MILFMLPILTVLIAPLVALSVGRHHPEPRYDKVVLRTILMSCAACWAFTGVELRWLWALSSAKHVHIAGGPDGHFLGILVHAYLWILLGLPAIPLIVVSVIECVKRRRQEQTLLIPFAMMAFCAVAAVLTTIWFEVFGR